MQELPHLYQVSAHSTVTDCVQLTSGKLPQLNSAAPTQFGGPGDLWSPEELLVAAVADCFILSFKAIAKASQFEWVELTCDVEGTLEKNERNLHFTQYRIKAKLKITNKDKQDMAERLLEKAEKHCLITNSLSGTTQLETEVRIA